MRLQLLPYLIFSCTHVVSPCSPALCSLGLNFSSQWGHHCWSGEVGQKTVSKLCCAVQQACRYWSQMLEAKVPRCPLTFAPHANGWSSGSSPASRMSLAKITTVFLRPLPVLGTPPFCTSSSFWNPKAPVFTIGNVQKHSVWSASWSVLLSHVSLLIGGFKSCHFCSGLTLSKFTTSPWLQLGSSRLLLDSLKVQLGAFIPCPQTLNYRLPVSVHNVSCIFVCDSWPCCSGNIFSLQCKGMHILENWVRVVHVSPSKWDATNVC